jgi:colanic acid biosynthesis glycosyl transferase WcaI
VRSPRDGRRGHIAFILANFAPERTGISQTATELAAFLAADGHDVRVATSMPYYPEWRIWPEYRGRLWRTDRFDGLLVRRSWHFVRPNPTTLLRLTHELTLSLFAVPNVIRTLWGANTAFVFSPALSYAFLALIVARSLGVRRVLVVKDIVPDAAVELGMARSGALVAVARWVARRAYAMADEIHTLGQGMARRIAREGVPPERIRVVPDTVDPEELAPVPWGENEFRHRFVPRGTFAVLHTGNMGKKQDLDVILDAADRLRGEPGIRFYLVGDGAVKERILRRRRDLGLENLEHHPLQERRLLPHMLSGADVVLVSQVPEVVDIVVPSKVLTALAAGAMIVAAAHPDSDTACMIRESGGGVVVPPSDPTALADALVRIRRGEVDVAACRLRGREYALRHFTRQQVYGPISSELSAAGGVPNPRATAATVGGKAVSTNELPEGHIFHG